MSATGPNSSTITVEFSPTTDPLATPSWVDITDAVMHSAGITVNRGRSFELDEFQTGTASFVLKNIDREFDPFYASGTYYGNLLPLKRFRISATHNSSTRRLFTGFCLGWPQEYDEADAIPVVPIQLVDGFELIAQSKLSGSVLEYAIMELGPLHFYSLSDDGPTFASDSVGTLAGTAFSEPTFGRPPLKLGLSESVEFDGVTDRIDLTRSLVLDDTFHASVVAVIRTDTAAESGSIHPIFAQNNGGGSGSDTGFTLYVNTSGLIAVTYIIDGAGYTFVSSSVVDGDTHLIIAQANQGEASDYGVSVDTATLSTTTTTAGFNGGNGAAIAGQPFAKRAFTDNAFPGFISHVGIFDSALTSANRDSIVAGYAAWDGDTTGERIGNVLDVIGWPAGERDIDTGLSTLGPAVLDGDPLSYMRRVNATEQGRLFIAGDGNVTFLDRATLLLGTPQTTSQATFGETGSSGELPVRAGQISIEQSRDTIRNVVTARTADGTEVEATDTASITAYGERTHGIDSMCSTPNEALNLAEYTVHRYADVQTRIPAFTLELAKQPAATDTWTAITLFNAALDLEIGDLVTVKRRPGGGTAISIDAQIEGVSHMIRTDSWLTTFRVSPADVQTYAVWGTGLWGTDVFGY